MLNGFEIFTCFGASRIGCAPAATLAWMSQQSNVACMACIWGRVLHSASGPVECGVEHEDLKECCMASVKAYNHADVHMPADTRGRRVRMSGWLFRVLRGYPCLLGVFCLG